MFKERDWLCYLCSALREQEKSLELGRSGQAETEWKSMFHPTTIFSPLSACDVAKCVYIDVKQHNTTSLPSQAQTSCLNMEIHSTDCCTIKCPDGSLARCAVFTRLPVPLRKSQKQVIFIVYIWRLQVYHVCINLLLQQRRRRRIHCGRLATQIKSARERERASEKRQKEEHVIDLTIKPLNITITTKPNDDARSENCLNTRFIIARRMGSSRDMKVMAYGSN